MQWRASHGSTSVSGWDKLIPGSMWVVRAMWVCENTTCAKSLVLCLSIFARNHWKVNREKRMWSTSFCDVVCMNFFGTVCNTVDEIIRMTLLLSTLYKIILRLTKKASDLTQGQEVWDSSTELVEGKGGQTGTGFGPCARCKSVKATRLGWSRLKISQHKTAFRIVRVQRFTAWPNIYKHPKALPFRCHLCIPFATLCYLYKFGCTCLQQTRMDKADGLGEQKPHDFFFWSVDGSRQILRRATNWITEKPVAVWASGSGQLLGRQRLRARSLRSVNHWYKNFPDHLHWG